ncbi:hypothetical protein [Sorangium sp. So ce1182]|uniref:hypothetical protein n=1 Tax=Sorangium sp. So ce1182 TaxID=3133334 RepID=UPI003F5EC476
MPAASEIGPSRATSPPAALVTDLYSDAATHGPRQLLHRVEAGRWRAARLRQRVDASGGLGRY